MTEQKRGPGRPARETLTLKPGEEEAVQQTASSETEQSLSASAIDQAVNMRLAEILPGLVESITKQVAQTFQTTQGGGDATSVIMQLANQLGELNKRGDGRPYVSPAEQTKRDNARAKLMKRLEEVNIAVATEGAEAPVYKLLAQVQDSDLGLIDHQVWEDRKIVNQEIVFLSIPNEAMQPKNAVAKEIHGLFMESIGGASGQAHHQGVLKTADGKLVYMKHARKGLVGGADSSTPTLDMTPLALAKENPATAQASVAGMALVGRGPDAAIERVNILGTVQEPAKMQRL